MIRNLALVTAALFCSLPVLADNTAEVLVQGDGIAITAADLTADSLRVPVPARKAALSRPETVQQVASTLYTRRSMAAEAEKMGLLKDPLVQAALQQARDKALFDAYIAMLDEKNKPDEATVDKLARDNYRANPKRFEAPEQVSARHILLKKDGEGAKAQAEKLLADLKAGADFEKLAKELSIDSGSAAKGGDLGFFGRGQMVAPFEEAAFALKKPGDLSGVVESQFGYHIIQLEQRRVAGTRPYDEVKVSLQTEVSNKLLTQSRIKESQRLLGKAKFNDAAIEAFSAQYR